MDRSPIRRTPLVTIALALTLVGSAQAAHDEDPSYGYFRVLDGSATLAQASSGEHQEAEVNQPVIPGDRLSVAPRSRVELLLPDRCILRLDGGTEVLLEQLAFSADSGQRTTLLRLIEGNLQLVVGEDALGDELPRVDTGNATVYIQNPGSYRIEADRGTFTEVVARDGYAEVVTQRGSAVVRSGNAAYVDGDSYPRIEVRMAAAEDALERWGSGQWDRYERSRGTYIDSSLSYAAAPLNENGSWVQVSGSWAWRPRVAASWRPYWQGRWCWTPTGWTWVSSEPWGWVPYHYGSWDYAPSWGWVWYPGYTYSPAWVYWYWGSDYFGWCPTGYYTRYYWPTYGYGHAGFRFGIYGWSGGSWGFYSHWNFGPVGCLRTRHQVNYWVPGNQLQTRVKAPELPRGIITTDTRTLVPERAGRPGEAVRVLRTRGEYKALTPDAALPDVTDFVARRRELPKEVERTVLAGPDSERKGERIIRTELEPRKVDGGRERGAGKGSEVRTPVSRGESKTPSLAERGKQDAKGSRDDWRVGEKPSARPVQPAAENKGDKQPTIGWRERPTGKGSEIDRQGGAESGKGGDSRRQWTTTRPSSPAGAKQGEPRLAPRSGESLQERHLIPRAGGKEWEVRSPINNGQTTSGEADRQSWRQGTGRSSAEVRQPSSGSPSRDRSPSNDGWKIGRDRAPALTAPEGSRSYHSGRDSGHDSGMRSERPAVRRVVEGMRQSRPEGGQTPRYTPPVTHGGRETSGHESGGGWSRPPQHNSPSVRPAPAPPSQHRHSGGSSAPSSSPNRHGKKDKD